MLTAPPVRLSVRRVRSAINLDLEIKIDFYSAISTQTARAGRYLFDDEILADYRAAWAAVVDAGLESEKNYVRFSLGFGLLWYGALPESQEHLEPALETSRRANDKILELRYLIYLCCFHLRQHDVGAVRELAPEGEELARTLAFPEFVGTGKAMSSWAAWREGGFDEAAVLAEAVLEQWHASVVHYCGTGPGCGP